MITTNPWYRPELVPPLTGADVLAFHRALPGYRPTPLHRLDGFWLKDESDRLGLPAFKILGASWAVQRALLADPSVGVLVAASAGNHGRAVAHEAARRGLGCRIYLPASASAARASLIAAEGAEVVRVDGAYDDAVARAGEDRSGAALIADTGVGGPAEWVVEGYSTLFHEISLADVDVVLVPVGVGSLAAAAVRWAVHNRPGALVYAVEPTTAACVSASLVAGEPVTVPTPGTSMAGLDCATPSAYAWPILRAGLAGAVQVTDAQAHDAMRLLARRGLTIGDCGAATVAALPLLGPAAEARVLCIGTEGASDPAAYRQVVERRDEALP